MKRFFTFLLLLITVAVGPSVLMGQQLTVLGFMEYTDDITARTQSGGRRDAQGNPCALVRVILVEPGATFASNDLIEASDLNVNQYLVYMAEGATTLDVSLPGFLPLKVKFAELSPEVSALQRESTYILTLATHNDGSNYQYLEIRVSPSDATLEVDHSIWEMRNGYAAKRVMLGNHDYRISAPNYHTEEGRIAVFDANNKTSKTFNLQPAFGKVNIFIDVEENQLAFYLDDKKMSRDAITQQTLPSGEHQLRIEGDGYKTYTETFVIIDGLITSLRPQLVPEYHYGSVAIESLPFGGATIQIDGKKIGTTPMVYNDLLVGQHLIRLSMAGFADKDTTITIKQGENLEITLNLQRESIAPVESVASSNNALLEPYQSENIATVEIVPTEGSQKIMVKGVTFAMNFVKGGTFTMGTNDANVDEGPAHSVTLSDYYIGEAEVTQALWTAVMGFNPSSVNNPEAPVDNVSWEECIAFIRNLNAITGGKITGGHFRLPTEAEWEYAAKGGNMSHGFLYAGSNRIEDVGWYTKKTIHSVKSKKPNELGLYDMTGNVWEWCQDYYDNYSVASQKNPQGPQKGNSRIVRGGSYQSAPVLCSNTIRNRIGQKVKLFGVGFRLAM